jgi:hypothetical protein
MRYHSEVDDDATAGPEEEVTEVVDMLHLKLREDTSDQSHSYPQRGGYQGGRGGRGSYQSRPGPYSKAIKQKVKIMPKLQKVWYPWE